SAELHPLSVVSGFSRLHPLNVVSRFSRTSWRPASAGPRSSKVCLKAEAAGCETVLGRWVAAARLPEQPRHCQRSNANDTALHQAWEEASRLRGWNNGRGWSAVPLVRRHPPREKGEGLRGANGAALLLVQFVAIKAEPCIP